METIIKYYRQVELFFGNLKFAVCIITVFATTLGYGTFMESYHGADYANRLVYKSLPFMGIQFLIFLSILFAAMLRLPPKKHLYGFYVIHTGLIILFVGSVITYISGVDGTMTLAPNLASRQIQLGQDEFKIQFPSKGKEVSVEMPLVASEKDLNMEYEGIKLRNFLPFADNKLTWIPTKIQNFAHTSARYRLFNDNFGEFITLSLHPESDFNNTLQLGPLNVHYMPESLAKCFAANTPEQLIVWNGENAECLSPTANQLKRRKGADGKSIAQIDFLDQKLNFLPELSPLPLNSSMELNEKSPFRIFSKKLFQKSPHLFLFGKNLAYFNKDTNAWEGKSFDFNQDNPLPWMGFRVRLLEYREDAYPTMIPEGVKPIQEGSQLIVGDLKALKVQIGEQSFWVRSGEPVAYNLDGEKITLELGKKNLTLPYEIVLDSFKMDTDPGTSTAASFESFITLFKGNEGSEKHHVFMNNPLKHKNFTFYQASYFPTQQGPYGSVLSVNFDPGRPWKYLGSLLLVLGSIWHYFLRRKHLAKPGASHG